MANIQNLKPFNSETAREAGRKGGVASGIAKAGKLISGKPCNYTLL